MRYASFTFRRARRPDWLKGIALAVIASLMVVCTAPLWHRHEDAAPGHDDDCSICAAVATPAGDGLPDLPLFEPPILGDLIRWMGSERFAVLWVGCDRASRGPPSRTA